MNTHSASAESVDGSDLYQISGDKLGHKMRTVISTVGIITIGLIVDRHAAITSRVIYSSVGWVRQLLRLTCLIIVGCGLSSYSTRRLDSFSFIIFFANQIECFLRGRVN
jgi:carbon starvation protein CstA